MSGSFPCPARSATCTQEIEDYETAKKSGILVVLSNVKLSPAFDAEEARLRALAVSRGSKLQPDAFGAPAAAAAAPARGRVERPGPAPLSTPRFHPLPATPAPRVPKPAPSRMATASGRGAAVIQEEPEAAAAAAAAAAPQLASGLTDYERLRSANMQRNHTLLTSLNIPQLCAVPLSIRVQEAREVQVMNFFPGVPSVEDVESGTIKSLSSEPIPARIFVSPVCPPAEETATGGRSAPQSPNASPSRSFRRRAERRGRRPTPPGLKAEAQRPPHCPSTHTHYRRHRCRHECGQRRAPRLRHREGAVPSPAH